MTFNMHAANALSEAKPPTPREDSAPLDARRDNPEDDDNDEEEEEDEEDDEEEEAQAEATAPPGSPEVPDEEEPEVPDEDSGCLKIPRCDLYEAGMADWVGDRERQEEVRARRRTLPPVYPPVPS